VLTKKSIDNAILDQRKKRRVKNEDLHKLFFVLEGLAELLLHARNNLIKFVFIDL